MPNQFRTYARACRTCSPWLLLLVGAIACREPGAIDDELDTVVESEQALTKAVDCADAEQQLRAQAMRRMNAQIDVAVENAYKLLSTSSCPRPTTTGQPPSASRGASAPNFPQPAPMNASSPPPPSGQAPPSASAGAPPASTPSPSSSAGPAEAKPPAAATPTTPASGAMASATSTTNNQVAAVDEADFVKNDAKYVYAAMNGALRILSAWPPEQAHELSKTHLDGTPKKLFVSEDRALVYLSVAAGVATRGVVPQPTGAASYAARAECTYGYDCQFGGDGTSTALLVFDISDRTQPKLLRRLDLRGSLVAARRIGNMVHSVVVTPEFVFSGLNTALPGIAGCDPWLTKEQIDLAAEAVRVRNKRIIEETPLPQLVPAVVENEQDYAANQCAATYYARNESGSAFTSLVSLALDQNAPPSITTIVSKAGAIYASEQSLYMAVPSAPQGVASSTTPKQYRTTLHKFGIGTSGQSSYQASGTIKGHVLNQFSMDEYAGHLRVATSSGKVPEPQVHSTLSVLEQHQTELDVVGSVDDIAPSEDIRSVRFDGEHGFVVTFKKTDPLYMFDLSQPDAPRITGELKIPGFSTYMHMLDDTHLLAIGYDADDQGTFAFFSGVLLQIFDVSKPTAPALLHKTVIGTRGSSSEALTNHLAFTLFQDKLAVPMTICEGGSAGSFGTNLTFSGLIVYDVSLDKGIVEHGRVPHPNMAGTYDQAGCTNWWTRASSVVQRSVFMDDYVYSIASDIMRVQRLSAMGSDVSSVRLSP